MQLKRQQFQFGPFRLDAADHILLREGKPLPLPPKAFETLVYLLENSGRLVTRDELISAIWPDSFVEDGSLSVNISLVRKALGLNENGQAYIETVPKKGYRFRPEVTSAAEAYRENPRDSLKVMPLEVTGVGLLDSHPPEAPFNWSRRRLWLSLALVASALALGWILREITRPEAFSAFDRMKIRRLTSRAHVVDAAISPDGKYIAYSLTEANGQSVWISQVATSADIRILEPEPGRHSSLTFSPDGNYLYYSRAGQDSVLALYRVPVLGGAAVKLLDGLSGPVAFSPDGQHFAFVRMNLTRWEAALTVANSDGTAVHEIARRKRPNYFSLRGLAWASDGRSIFCFTGNSADYYRQAFHLTQVQLADGAERAVASRGWAWTGPIVASRDGLEAFVLASEHAENALQIWRISLQNGKVSRVTNDLSDYSALSVTADGRSLAAVQTVQSGDFWIAPSDDTASALPALSADIQDLNGLTWAPDGNILYSSRVGDHFNMFQIGSDLHSSKQLTFAPGNQVESAVTRDGRYIVFQSSGKIWRMNRDGTNTRELTYGGHDVHPVASADSKSVVYASFANWSPSIGGKPSLWAVSIDGGKPVQLTEFPTSLPQVSPNGKLVASAYFPGGDPRFSQNKIAVFAWSGGKPINIFNRQPGATDAVYWSPDGTALDYVATAQGVGNIWRQPLSGSSAIELTHFNAEELFDFAWSPDARRLLMARGKHVSDVVLINDSSAASE